MRSGDRCRGLLLLAVACALWPSGSFGDTCTTQSQIAATQRDAIANTARNIASQTQSGDIQAIRANTLSSVAANFSGIADSIGALKPLLQSATITVHTIYLLDAPANANNAQASTFYCSPPASPMTVVLNFSALPQGKYAIAILHATGVVKPQQIALVLSQADGGRWQLAGFFSKPMLEAGHDGTWYWTQAREYATKKMSWNAWYYYQTAARLLQPADFISSPNLDKLRREADQVRPGNLPDTNPIPLTVNGEIFNVTQLYVSGELGNLDLVVHYAPTAAQAALLRDPVRARQQVLDIMKTMLTMHPELQQAFHGVWVHANSGDAQVFALELPMSQIIGTQPTA